MTDKEMLEWLIDRPEVSVRRSRNPEYFIAFDTWTGLSTLAQGPEYKEVIEEAARVLPEREHHGR